MMSSFYFDYCYRQSIGLVLALVLGLMCFAQQPEAARFSAPLELPSVDKTSLASLTFESGVYAQGSRGLIDLRLYDSENNLVSFVVRQQFGQREERSRTNRPITSPELKFPEGNRLEISFKIDPEKSPEPLVGILIRTQLREFERRATLEWDQGSGQWVKLASDVLLYDYSSVLDLRNLEIQLPQPLEIHKVSNFRMVIDKVTEAQEGQIVELTRRLRGENEEYREERLLVNRRPFRIDELQSSHEIKEVIGDSPLKTSYPVKLVSQRELKDERSTELVIESQGEPLIGFQLQTADDNFSRMVSVATEEPDSVKSPAKSLRIGGGTISKIHLPGSELEQLEVTFPETTARRYYLLIANQDSQPLQFSTVKAIGNSYQLFFLAQPDQQYRLEYGGGENDVANFDTVAISTALEKRIESIPAKLGAASVLKPGAAKKPEYWNIPVSVFWLIAACLVALIASGLCSAVKRVDGLN